MNNRTKRIVLIGLLGGIAAVLAMIPIYGSVGLDAMPGFLAALFISPVVGGIVGVFGYVLALIFKGASFSPVAHLVIAAMMFVTCGLYGYTRLKVNRYVGMVVGILMNSVVSLYVAGFVMVQTGDLPSIGAAFSFLFLPLLVMSSVSILLADYVYEFGKESFLKNLKA